MSEEFPRSRSPLKALAASNIAAESYALVKFGREAQIKLGCLVNEQVLVECPYAFVDCGKLIKEMPKDPTVNPEEESEVPIGPMARLKERMTDEGCEAPHLVLIGYQASGLELQEDPGEFVICLTEDSTAALITYNRSITKRWHDAVLNEVLKTPKTWLDQGAKEDLEHSIYLKPSRQLLEVELELPLNELITRRSLHSKQLSNRDNSKVRDGCVDLVPPSHENFSNVDILHVAQTSQTTLESRDGLAQTRPRRPRNQCTQYELEVPREFLEIWRYEEASEIKVGGVEENGEDQTTLAVNGDEEEEIEKSEEELRLEEARRNEWNKLKDFLNDRVEEILDCISFNAATNLFTNDCANLAIESDVSTHAKLYEELEEDVTLIDLKTVEDRYLLSASWHHQLDDVIACTYLDKKTEGDSLIAVWSLKNPLRPIMVLDCENKIASLSFSPIDGYTDILIGGSLDGRIIVWEIHRGFLTQENEDAATDPPLRRAMIASSTLNHDAPGSTITNLQWLPTWCHISPDGKIHKTTSSTSIRAQFASSSLEGPISFWSLPRSLSTPASHRSPLQLTLAPTYQLSFPQEFPPITSFCLPIGRSEGTSRLNLREDNKYDLARLQQLFVGTSTGKVCRCTWSGLDLEDDEVADGNEVEICEMKESCAAHDGWVRSMVKSPHLDDVMLTVGGSVFALWKEDFARAPIFSRRSGLLYGDGCWSNGRPGLIVLARMDGCFEMWDLKRRSSEPVITQTVSREVTPYVYPSSTTSSQKFLAVLDGASTLRVFREATESRDNEDLERLEWFEEFAWRETKRKLDFHRWQDEYLREHPVALQRQQERRQAEADRKRREAREKFLKVLGVLCIILGSPGYHGHSFFVFVAITTFILSVIWSLIYLFSLREACRLPMNWILTELLNTLIYTVMYFVAFITILAMGSGGSSIAAGIFGIFNTMAYGVGAYFLYLEWRNSQ